MTEIEQSKPFPLGRNSGPLRVLVQSVQRGFGALAKEIQPAAGHPRVARARRPRTTGHWSCAFRDRSGGLRLYDRSQAGEDMMMASPVVPELTAATILVAFAGVFLICFMKGAFGGGFCHCWHSAVVDRDGPSDRRRPARAVVCRDGPFRTALLEAFNLVETGPCAAVAGARDRYRARLSAVPLSGPPRHSDRDGGDHPDLCQPMVFWRRGR